LRQEGKPEAMLDNIAKGKLARFFKDNTLVNQDYIKDKLSVANYVKSLDKDLIVTGFKRAALDNSFKLIKIPFQINLKWDFLFLTFFIFLKLDSRTITLVPNSTILGSENLVFYCIAFLLTNLLLQHPFHSLAVLPYSILE
jgi:hypothetical protein